MVTPQAQVNANQIANASIKTVSAGTPLNFPPAKNAAQELRKQIDSTLKENFENRWTNLSTNGRYQAVGQLLMHVQSDLGGKDTGCDVPLPRQFTPSEIQKNGNDYYYEFDDARGVKVLHINSAWLETTHAQEVIQKMASIAHKIYNRECNGIMQPDNTAAVNYAKDIREKIFPVPSIDSIKKNCANWANLNAPAREKAILEFSRYIASDLGLNYPPNVRFNVSNDGSQGGNACVRDGVVECFPEVLTENNPYRVLELIAHEMRHIYQEERIKNPQNDTERAWAANTPSTPNSTYVRLNADQSNLDAYERNAIEMDSNIYARKIRRLLGDTGGRDFPGNPYK